MNYYQEPNKGSGQNLSNPNNLNSNHLNNSNLNNSNNNSNQNRPNINPQSSNNQNNNPNLNNSNNNNNNNSTNNFNPNNRNQNQSSNQTTSQNSSHNSSPNTPPKLNIKIEGVNNLNNLKESFLKDQSIPNNYDDINDELEKLIASQKTRIKVIGCGGGGNNTINRISEVGIKGIQTIAINTDAQDLLYTTADKKLLIGRELTRGIGAGSNPKLGEEAAKENEHDLKKLLEDTDMLFITCGLGGGTGTGSAPFVAQLAKKMNIISVGIVTMPFCMEGQHRLENALMGLEKLEQNVNTLIIIPNEKLLEIAPNLPLQTAFKVADEVLTNSVKGIAELVTRAGLVNLDFADVKTIMNEGGVALIGVGESDTENRAETSVIKALENPLIDVDISNATGALINISGGESLTLNESRRIVETVSERLDPHAKIIWGAQIYKDLDKTVRTLVIITGVKSDQIFGADKSYFSKKINDLKDELGIEFVN